MAAKDSAQQSSHNASDQRPSAKSISELNSLIASQPPKRVVLTRPPERQDTLARHLRQSGCEVLELPALTISPIAPASVSERSQQIEQPEQSRGDQFSGADKVANWQPSQFDVLVFVSRGAWHNYHRFYIDGAGADFCRTARFGFGQPGLKQGSSDQPRFESSGAGYQSEDAVATDNQRSNVQRSKSRTTSVAAVVTDTGTATAQSPRQSLILACVGLSTAQQIASDLELPLSAITYPTEGLSADSEGLWALLKAKLAPGAKVLIVRGQTGRDWLADTITQYGAAVTCLSVYRREPAVWSAAQLNILRKWAAAAIAAAGAQASGKGERVEGIPISGTGTWLITSAEGLAAIEQQCEFHGLTGKPGFAPEKVVVIHERLVAPVCRWLANWQNLRPNTTIAALDANATDDERRRHSGVQLDAVIPLVVVAPDDEAIAAGVMRGRSGDGLVR